MYAYKAALYCDFCGDKIRDRLEKEDPTLFDTEDSDRFPQYYSDLQDESDTPDHCGLCHVFLKNSLTTDGYNYLYEKVIESIQEKRQNLDTIKEWVKLYSVTAIDLLNYLESTH